MASFSTWLMEHKSRIGPGPAEIISIIASAGNNGITRKELGGITTLPGRVLNHLLAAYCDLGLIRVTTHGDEMIYHASSWLRNGVV